MSRPVIESDAWFRLRWFLIGSLVSLITVFVVAPKRAPQAAEAVAPAVTVVPTVVPAKPSAAQKRIALPKHVPSKRTPTPRRVVVPAANAPAAKVAAAKAPARPPAKTRVEPAKADPLNSVRAALAALRAKPQDGQRRSKLERTIEVAAGTLGPGAQAAIRRCVIQAGFEGRAAVATEHLGACVLSLEKAIQ